MARDDGAQIDSQWFFFFVWSMVVRWSKKGGGALGNCSGLRSRWIVRLELLVTDRHLCRPVGLYLFLFVNPFYLFVVLCGGDESEGVVLVMWVEMEPSSGGLHAGGNQYKEECVRGMKN